MKDSFITISAKLIKKVLGIKDFSMTMKIVHKKIGRILYHKKYNSDDIVQIMMRMGMREGSIVCIHAGMKEFYNFRGSPEDLILKIMGVLTHKGTLIMPAYPDKSKFDDQNYIFDVNSEPTKAGLLAETFRHMPEVKRSINIQHSICAWGKYADYLTNSHQNCVNCWDRNSPWFRLTRLGGLVFYLGLPKHYLGTYIHCVEGTLFDDYPYWSQFFNVRREYKYYCNDGTINSYFCLEGKLDRRTDNRKVIKYLDKNIHKFEKLSNLLIVCDRSKDCLDIMLDLGRRGITIYYVPSPKKYFF